MRQRFWPVYHSDCVELAHYGKIQRSFYESAKNVATLYGLTILDTTGIPYPLNVHYCFEDLQQQITAKRPDLSLAIMQGAGHHAVVSVLKPLNINASPFHIPLYPVYKLLGDRKCQRMKPLILGILAILRNKYQFSHYIDNYSYMANMYNYCEEMMYDEKYGGEEEMDYSYIEDEITLAYKVGKQVFTRIVNFSKYHRFPAVVSRFQARTAIQKELKALALRFIALDRAYPDRQMLEEIPEGWLEPGQDQRISKDQLFSFVFDLYGYLADCSVSMIDADFQDAYGMDVPLAIQYFDTPQSKESLDLTYEQTTITLINEFDNFLRKARNAKY